VRTVTHLNIFKFWPQRPLT